MKILSLTLLLIFSFALQNNFIFAMQEKNKEEAQCNTRLFMAIFYGNTENAKKALVGGADINAKNAMGKTPIHLALMHNCIEIIDCILAYHFEVMCVKQAEGINQDGLNSLEEFCKNYGYDELGDIAEKLNYPALSYYLQNLPSNKIEDEELRDDEELYH